MPLPIVSGSEVQTPVGGTKLDSGAFREAALQPGRLGAAIGQEVGGLFQDISQKVQANRNARQVFDADLTMRKAKDDFTAKLVEMPDEGTWLPAWKSQVDQVRQGVIDNPQAGPDVKRMLSQKFDIWEAATTAEIRTAALQKGVKETRDSAVADSTYAAHQGDLEGAHHILDAAVAHYAMTPEEAHKISARFPSISAQAQADMAIATNPIKAPEIIKQFEGVIEPAVYVSVKAKADAARNRAQADNVNDLAQDMDNSPTGAVDPSILKQKVQDGDITQRAADGLIARMRQQTARESQANFNLQMMGIQDHDFTTDKNPQETARSMKDEAAGLPEAYRKRVFERVDSKVAAAQRQARSDLRPVEQDIFQTMSEERMHSGTTIPLTSELKQKASSGIFGIGAHPEKVEHAHVEGGLTALRNENTMTDDQIEKMFGKGVTREQILRAEQQHYADQQAKMRAWFADPSNKDADYEKAEKYLRSIQKPYVMDAIKTSLSPAPAQFDKGKVYRDSSGRRMKWDGNKFVAP